MRGRGWRPRAFRCAPLADLDALKAAAGELGYPLMLKPVAGGGGIGMARVAHARDLAAAFATARAQAARAFGDGAVYAERCLERPRHIEFQVLGDGATVTSALERECSVQRRHQKVIEEAPAPGSERRRLARVEAAAVAALAGYDSHGGDLHAPSPAAQHPLGRRQSRFED